MFRIHFRNAIRSRAYGLIHGAYLLLARCLKSICMTFQRLTKRSDEVIDLHLHIVHLLGNKRKTF